MKYTACYGREEIQLFDPPPGSVLICIHDPDTDPPLTPLNYVDKLFLTFWDTAPDKPDRVRFPALADLMPPATHDQIIMIYSFIQQNKENNIFVSCEAGISRSAAVREYLIRRGWTYFLGNGTRPSHPNNYILRNLERLDFAEALE